MEYTVSAEDNKIKQNSSTPFRQAGDSPVELTDEQVDMVAGGVLAVFLSAYKGGGDVAAQLVGGHITARIADTAVVD
jgi:hypothetical protein